MAAAGWELEPDMFRRRSAAIHTVRAALPTVHARALKPDPDWGPGWPKRLWRNREDLHWVAFEWGDEGGPSLLGLARDGPGGIVPMDAVRWARHQANQLPSAPALPCAPAGLSFIDFDEHFEPRWLAAPASPTSAEAQIAAETPLARALKVEAEVIRDLDEKWPRSPDEPDWASVPLVLDWRLPKEHEHASICAILAASAPTNFSLPEPPAGDAVKLAVRDTPFYDGALLVRLVDLRGERTRIAHFLADLRTGTVLALGRDSGPIHGFNETMSSQARLRIDARTCAEYVRFFCEFVQGDAGAFMVLRSADDMDWLDESRRSAHPTEAIKPLRLRFLGSDPGDGEHARASSGEHGPIVAVCVAYINHDRYVFFTGLVVHASGRIRMETDSPIQDGDWPVAPTLFDEEFQFRLGPTRQAADDLDVQRRDARGSRRDSKESLPSVLAGLPTGPGELDPCRLRRHAQLHDSVDLRGHEFAYALLVYGVVFWGRVDLRSSIVKGDLDLTRCVFLEGLLLDDAEIQGSLILRRTSASHISLRGVQVQGRLDLSEANLVDWLRAEGANVQGALDARGISATVLSMNGLKLQGELQLGCRKALYRGYANTARVQTIDARDASVNGSVVVTQPGRLHELNLVRPDRERPLFGQLPDLDFTNATINGSLSVLPNLNVPADTDFREPALGCLRLLLVGARIKGDLKLAALLVAESLEASHAEVGGNVDLQGVWVRGRTRLDDMRVAGWMGIAPYRSSLQIDAKRPPLPSRFDFGLDLELTRAARLVLGGVDCRGDLNVWGVQSESMLRLAPDGDLPCRVRAVFPLGKEQAGNLNAYGLRALQLDLDGVDVEGDIALKGVDLLELLCRPELMTRPGALDDRAPEQALLLPRCAHFSMVNARVRGNVELVCIQITGGQSRGSCGLLIQDSEIGGELLLAQSDVVDRLFLGPRQPVAEPDCAASPYRALVSAVAGQVTARRCTFGAQLDLTGVQVDRGIDLEDSKLVGDLLITARPGVPLAHATHLQLRKLHCANDVDLTGLVLGDPGAMTTRHLLTASHTEVTADLHLCRQDRERWSHARIHGGIDFSFARLAHLVVHRAVVVAPAAQLDLRHAQITRMQIPRGTSDEVSLPETRLRGSNIELWDPETREDDPHRLYCRLLDFDVDRSPEAAAALERRLRLDGQTAVADSVYRYGYDRQFRDELGPLPQPFRALPVRRWLRGARHGAFKLSLGFGTQIYRLLLALLALAVLALPITRAPSNFEPSLGALAVPQDRLTPAGGGRAGPGTLNASVFKGSTPRPEDWGPAEAVQLMLKNWLPILPLHARDDWQPRSEGRTAWSWQGNAVCEGNAPTALRGCLPLSPEDWLNAFQLLSWMGWPLLLTMFVRRVLRQ